MVFEVVTPFHRASVCGRPEPLGPPLTGAKGANRTRDTALFRRVLYRLSYLGSIVVERTALTMRSTQAGDADGARTHDLRRDRATL